jgi:carboxyl-terminal processing protease
MGYVNVPAFHGGNEVQMLAFADSLQFAIQELYNRNIKGWIVDLRQNTGGNMAPMIAGLGPLFSSSKLGSLEDVNGNHNAWYYNNGKYSWDDDSGWTVTKPVTLVNKFPIAVLTSNQTGSSGEAVAISFIGNKNTRSFGSPTWGLTTGNGSFDLADGSQIYLASTIMADRNRKKYYGQIEPDEKILPGKSDTDDTVLNTAIKWLKTF